MDVLQVVENMVGLGRFELPTHGLGNRCSIHLSYRPAIPTLCVDCRAAEKAAIWSHCPAASNNGPGAHIDSSLTPLNAKPAVDPSG